MYGFFGLMKDEVNIFKFVSWDAVNENSVKSTAQYNTLKRLEQGEKLDYDTDFKYLYSYAFIETGCYKTGGWCLDFRNLLNRYVVLVKDWGWLEFYGYNKMFLRKVLGNHNVKKIVQI